MTATIEHPTQAPPRIRLLELELTGRCQLACVHCLTTSSPTAPVGTMTLADWTRVLDQAAELGVETVQLIGGEPLLSPHAVPLIEYALRLGLNVQVYSNLYAVTDRIWDLLARPGVSIGTSVYSDRADEHDRVTTKPGSYARNRANILKALALGIDVQVGIVRTHPGQRVEEARTELAALGVGRIVLDDARPVGRANTTGRDTADGDLCGRCGDERAAILPDGTLTPCVLGRHLRVGDVTAAPLAGLLTGEAWRAALGRVPAVNRACPPGDSNDCDPANTYPPPPPKLFPETLPA
jgi:sulfatase maturation enzyme AslB (radical SAM superfamily)